MNTGFCLQQIRQSVQLMLILMILAGCFWMACADDATSPVIARNDLVFLPAHQLAGMIREGKVTSSEVVEAYLAQIEKHNKRLNAIVTLDAEGARRQAREADEAQRRGEIRGPLHGVPVTIKDNIAVAGMKTTSGVPALADYVPDADAPVVDRLRKAGAIIMGKTNLPVLAMDVQTNNPVFGRTQNPWDLSRTPGGSSGGAAAAIAGGLSALEIGNDLGGSIRIPSHFCGVYGLKPTEYVVPRVGMNPGFPPSDIPKTDFNSFRYLVHQGPIARSVEDLKLALTIIAGPHPDEVDVPYVNLSPPPKKELKDLRIAVSDNFGGITASVDTREAMKNLSNRLAAQGCRIENLNPPGFDYALIRQAFSRMLDLQMGPNIPWYGRVFQYVFGWSRRQASGSDMVIPQTYEKFLQSLTLKEELTSKMEKFLLPYDAFICPVTVSPAFQHIIPDGYSPPLNTPYYTKPMIVDDKPFYYWTANGAYTIAFNLTGHPVVVIPVGYTKEGLPIGIQIVGKRWRDMELLEVAAQLDQAAKQYRRPPGY